MGVTGAIFKGLTFDGEDSKDYGVYITGQAVYNSPERDVEMISIPGRDGAFALDRGRFSNIEVTYPAGLFGVDEADFAQAIADFRNMLGSRVGYCRLEDEYNPGEYRMAVFKAGLEVNPASLESGEFDIVFECKPQRWLTSGEAAVAVTSGDDITNPTLFDARPMLQVWGYGDIDLGGQELEIISTNIGWTTIGASATGTASLETVINGGILNVGDEIAVSNASFGIVARYTGSDLIVDRTFTKSASLAGYGTLYRHGSANYAYSIEGEQFYKGTAKTIAGNLTIAIETANEGTYSMVFAVAYSYDGDSTFTMTLNATSVPAKCEVLSQGVNLSEIRGNSTQSALGSPIYFDLDIGEAYKIEGGVPVSVNNAVTIPAVLPTLPPGATTITYDNTITQFKVVPRWWQL